MVLLHGYLDIQIISGTDLGKVKPKGFLNRLSALALQSGIDPYVSVALGGKNKYFQSRVINNSSDPVWESSVLLDVCHELDFVELRVKGAARPGIGRTRKLGRVELPADELVQSGSIEGTYDLVPYGGDDDGSDAEEGRLGSVTVKMRLLPLDAYADRLDVPGTYFPLRTGCQVRLYQDAHVDEGELPAVDGSSYTPGCCFRDMFNAMEAAQDFIYITGWSVFTETALLRERHGGGDDPETLGVFLKRKAEEGVQVRIMVWDELMSTSGSVLGHDFEHKGMMMTHDEGTWGPHVGGQMRCGGSVGGRARGDVWNILCMVLLVDEGKLWPSGSHMSYECRQVLTLPVALSCFLSCRPFVCLMICNRDSRVLQRRRQRCGCQGCPQERFGRAAS